MMEALWFELGASGRLSEVSPEDARRRWRARDGVFFIEMKGVGFDEIGEVLADFGVTGLLARRVLRSGKHSSLIAIGNAVFAEWVSFRDEACAERTHVTALCLDRLVITTEREAMEPPDEQDVDPTHRGIDFSEVGPSSTSAILCAMLLWHGGRTGRAARMVRDRLLELDAHMDEDPGSVDDLELAELKQQLLRVEAVATEQLETFTALSEAESSALDFSDLRGPISLLTSTAAATDRLVDRMDGRFLNLRSRSANFKQDKLNRRLGVLTVISTIFLPLTLLAGIWGMNFSLMPELNVPYGYPLALTLMLAIGGAVALFLRSRGWFD